MPTIAVRIPNGALTSLAGNVDPHHRVAAADLLLVQNRGRESVERLVAEHEPDVVGLSVMTFQRKTAKGIIDLVRTRRPRARIVVGGYDPSLAPEVYGDRGSGDSCCCNVRLLQSINSESIMAGRRCFISRSTSHVSTGIWLTNAAIV
jgi:hypothetical protein